MTREKATKRYLRQIIGLLPCSGKMKNVMMQQIRESIDDYFAENPNADVDELRAQFGAPESIAAAYIENTGTAEILKSMRIRRKVVGIFAAVFMTALFAWMGYLVWTSVQVNQVLNGYDEVYIVDGTVVDPEEFDSISYAP